MKGLRTVVLLALVAVTARGDDWTHAGRDDGRTRAPSESIDSPAALGAPVSTGSLTVASLAAADGYLVTTGLDGTVRGYRESDRTLLWFASTGSILVGTPLIDRGRVYVPSTDGTLRILRLETGDLLSTVDTGGADRSSPVQRGGRIYLGSGFPNTSLIAIPVGSSSIEWSAPLGHVTESSPAFAGGNVLMATQSGSLAAFDEVTGAPVWTTSVGGTLRCSSPLILGTAAYVLAGSRLTRVSLNPADWDGNGSNGAVTFVDPVAAPPTATDVESSASSLSQAGGLLVGVVRFDYPRDDYPPGGDTLVDQWTLREYAVAVDPSTLSVVWQVSLGEATYSSQSLVPPFGIVPAPVSLGTTIAVASSVSPALALLSPATGAPQGSLPLGAPCQASPIVANARLYALTTTGVLHAFQGTHAPPSSATGLVPANVEVLASPASLAWDPVAGATYHVRIASDGEILMDWDHEFVVVVPSVACPTLADGMFHTWGVRVQDATTASAPWTTVTFAQNMPEPPSNLTAAPENRRVVLTWTGSPSPSVTGYRLSHGLTGGPLGTTVDLGPVTTTTVTGLTGGVSHTFELRALNGVGGVSSPISVDATPLALITVGAANFDSVEAAAAAALPGQTILVGAGTWPVNATIDLGPQVQLIGIDAHATRLEASGAFIMIDAQSQSSVRQVSLAMGSVGVHASGSNIMIVNCVIRDMSDSGVVVLGTAEIVNNTIVNCTNAGVGSAGSAIVRNNILQGNGIGLTGLFTSTYNDVVDGYAFSGAGVGDLAAPVAFLDAASGDYREQPGQPSVDAGSPADPYPLEPAPNGSRINMGAFGNTIHAATTLPPTESSSSGCGLTGLEAVLLLAVLRRRR